MAYSGYGNIKCGVMEISHDCLSTKITVSSSKGKERNSKRETTATVSNRKSHAGSECRTFLYIKGGTCPKTVRQRIS